ncbi:hypothetical protein [Xanthomonas hortorum]|uniref:hypothetical protein n=1 Tax=Xanthomonas hortorum TaxID=56454 RepID=UPI001F30F96B|nr:hypothetical protein [Xanthomonas hortorum]MCE4364824.1 hypothetical protein [Xanthomonas hortorum]
MSGLRFRKIVKFFSSRIVSFKMWFGNLGLIKKILFVFVPAIAILYFGFISNPSGEVFSALINVVILSGILLVASGAVVSRDFRSRLYDIRQGKDVPGIADTELAELIIETSDNCEAGTLVIVIGTVILVVHSIFGSSAV